MRDNVFFEKGNAVANDTKSATTWCPGAIQIRTSIPLCFCGFQVAEADRVRAVFVVIGDDQLVVVEEDGVDEGVDQHLPMRRL
jgi:hypothetical protein